MDTTLDLEALAIEHMDKIASLDRPPSMLDIKDAYRCGFLKSLQIRGNYLAKKAQEQQNANLQQPRRESAQVDGAAPRGRVFDPSDLT